MTEKTLVPTEKRAAAAPALRWHRRVFQSPLYGRNVDRAAKTKARLGLAMVGFAVIYAIIAGRLVLYAVAPESRISHRGGTVDAVATARPDLVDRNGEILATDLKVPSLFAEPRRIIDPDEAFVQSAPPGLGPPSAVIPLSIVTMYVYPYDIASRLSTGECPAGC